MSTADEYLANSALLNENAADILATQSEYQLDIDNLPVAKHNWTDRGDSLTCSLHPEERVYKKHK